MSAEVEHQPFVRRPHLQVVAGQLPGVPLDLVELVVGAGRSWWNSTTVRTPASRPRATAYSTCVAQEVDGGELRCQVLGVVHEDVGAAASARAASCCSPRPSGPGPTEVGLWSDR